VRVDVLVREATTADLPTILEHRRRMFEDMGYGQEAALDAMVAAAREPLRRWLVEGLYRGWLVERGGMVAASGGILITIGLPHAADHDTRRATILNVYTEPAHRRRGLARALMAAMIAWCRDQGLPAVTLDASADGRALYEEMGFRPTTQMRLPLTAAAQSRR
jgi:ribosomal protein S18 acetylase RimI-like enzyme